MAYLRRPTNRKGPRRKLTLPRAGNFGFLLSIPALIALAACSIAILLISIATYDVVAKHWILAGCGLAASLILAKFTAAQRLRTLVHEIKHGVVVVFSGNSVKGLQIGKGSGQIDYTLRYDKLHFAPVICLAPYFLPLFSAPMLLGAVIFEQDYQLPLLFFLGFTLGIDTSSGFHDLHPRQTDLKRIIGGFAIASIFIAAFHLFWITLCLIWIQAGNAGYIAGWNFIVARAEAFF